MYMSSPHERRTNAVPSERTPMRWARCEEGSVSLGYEARRNGGARLLRPGDGMEVSQRPQASPRSQHASDGRRLAPWQRRGYLWSGSDSQRSVVRNWSRADGTCWVPIGVRTSCRTSRRRCGRPPVSTRSRELRVASPSSRRHQRQDARQRNLACFPQLATGHRGIFPNDRENSRA